ncbi:MupA/Atu3671 family FMN-dependent luciferase-like monooxygenase [Lysobacter enzymogenes]|uniref:MupA/Atu3671 family FMN-dependent luciferase-like monooxygenase n=1 Tax=Lysobacter enzymogenes TaxID=69 RepID=UPI002265496F|nr:MupA/Atu3671 family FMN-dependent luciferase-like monooxygenase [Lysobacter enzymogenes]UZW58365.1 LLM class flavin-dependent oxidoreductase [Lysobacter enzymogenes]
MNDRIEDRIAALTPQKKALLERQLNQRVRPAPEPAAPRADATPVRDAQAAPTAAEAERGLDFSFLFFSGDGASSQPDKYRLLLECARYADANGYAALWAPERHFKPFGGLYPNPAVIAAALAMVTERIELRAGSVVLPLQNPLRVVEEWSVVDNLSNGRVAIAFASGWLADDFVLAPERYPSRRELMFREIETVRKLWRGESVELRNGQDEPTQVRVYPNPIQAQPPIWITATGKGTFVEAGKIGANVLTGLMEQGLEQCADSIQAYRRARRTRPRPARRPGRGDAAHLPRRGPGRGQADRARTVRRLPAIVPAHDQDHARAAGGGHGRGCGVAGAGPAGATGFRVRALLQHPRLARYPAQLRRYDGVAAGDGRGRSGLPARFRPRYRHRAERPGRPDPADAFHPARARAHPADAGSERRSDKASPA